MATRPSVEEWTVRQLNKDVVTLILVAWNCGCTNAKLAVVDRADPCGFDLRSLDTMGRAVHHRVTYQNAPCTTADAVRKEIVELRERASRPRVPMGPLTLLAAAMWLLVVSAWLHQHDVHVLEQRFAKLIGLHKDDVPSSRVFLGYATAAILATNALEAAAVAYLAKSRFRFSTKSTVAWFGATLVLGYPLAQKMVDLKHSQSQAALRTYKAASKKGN